jgi:hypothetical protein
MFSHWKPHPGDESLGARLWRRQHNEGWMWWQRILGMGYYAMLLYVIIQGVVWLVGQL